MKWEITLALVLCFFSMANSIITVHQQSKNLIVNGDFSNPALPSSGWFGTEINGWVGLPVIELGVGANYNSNWGSTQVTELDANNQNCVIAQRVYGLTKGQRCTLSYSWAGRPEVSLDSSQIRVLWNGGLIQEGRPSDHNIHQESFQVTADGQYDTVVFMGSGKNDGGGATLSRVSLTCP